MEKERNPLSWYAVCVALTAIIIVLGAKYFGYRQFISSYAHIIVGICSLTAIVWTLFEFKRGYMSMVLQNGRFAEFSRKKHPLKFYSLFIVYLTASIFLFWGVTLGGVAR